MPLAGHIPPRSDPIGLGARRRLQGLADGQTDPAAPAALAAASARHGADAVGAASNGTLVIHGFSLGP